MDSFTSRQIEVLRKRMLSYREHEISLNSLIQDIGGIGAALSHKEWEDAVFPIIFSMEQINAAAIDEKRNISESEKELLHQMLLDIEKIISRFYNK